MPGNMVKPEDGAHGYFYTGRRAVQGAHRFWSLPAVNQELAGPGSAEVERTRSLSLRRAYVCVCVRRRAPVLGGMFPPLCPEEGRF